MPSPPIFLPVCQQLWLKAIASLSLCLFQRSMEHVVYNHLLQQHTPLAELTLHTAPISWELQTHWDIASYFWKQSLDCYWQSAIYTESKVSLSRRHSIIHYQAGHRPVVRKLYHKFSSLCVLPYSKGTKHWGETRSFGEQTVLCRATYLHICHTCPYLGLFTLKTATALF